MQKADLEPLVGKKTTIVLKTMFSSTVDRAGKVVAVSDSHVTMETAPGYIVSFPLAEVVDAKLAEGAQ